MKKLTVLVLMFFISFFACTTHNKILNPDKKESSKLKLNSKINFYTGGTFAEIKERAINENKLIFIDFTADWCAPCNLMEEVVYSYRELYEKINNNFISYQVEVEKDYVPTIALMYGVRSLPTILFLDSIGNVLVKKEGSADIQTILNLSEEAIGKSR